MASEQHVDPLEAAFVRPEQVEGDQRALLASMIVPFAGINAESGEVHFKATVNDLNARQKIIVYLLCRLALSTRPNTAFSAAVSPKEIEKATNLPGGTVRPKLSQLADARIATRSGEGYLIPASSLHIVHAEFESILPSE